MLVLNELEWAATDPRRSSTRCRNAVRHPAISRTEHQLGIMSEDTKLEDARNEVLRKIGRNVLNLQKMEGMLKLLNTHANISGNIDDLESVSRKQSESVSRHTMGRLVQAFVQSVYLHQTDLNIESESDSKPSISFSFTIEGDADLATEREKALLSIVEERNRLIHTDLLQFRPNSLRCCMDMGERLDEQNKRILPEYEMLQSVLQTFREGRAKLAEYIQSDAFAEELATPKNG